MSDLVLNSFPVELAPKSMQFPFVECNGWKASTELRRAQYNQHRTYRYEADSPGESESDGEEATIIRLLLLSGPPVAAALASAEVDIAQLPSLGAKLIEHSLSQFLEAQGLSIKSNRFERLALQRVESSSNQLIQLFTGISFQARRPFKDHPYAFTLSAQWVARATFSESLRNETLCEISPSLAVLYTPKGRPLPEIQEYENQYLGRVRDTAQPPDAVVACRDNALRRIPLGDLTLEASPEAIRRYEQKTGTSQQPLRVWRRLQQLSQVLTTEGRRNTAVLRNRLEAIRGLLGGVSKEQLILPLDSYQSGTVSIGLSPLRVEMSQ